MESIEYMQINSQIYLAGKHTHMIREIRNILMIRSDNLLRIATTIYYHDIYIDRC